MTVRVLPFLRIRGRTNHTERHLEHNTTHTLRIDDTQVLVRHSYVIPSDLLVALQDRLSSADH